LQIGWAYKTQATKGAVGTNVWTHTADDATSENGITVVCVRPLDETSQPTNNQFNRTALQAAQRAATW
jgi:protein tyrosine phosphatase (PTP) superfamily phosphohydrolase (DUF442 family)